MEGRVVRPTCRIPVRCVLGRCKGSWDERKKLLNADCEKYEYEHEKPPGCRMEWQCHGKYGNEPKRKDLVRLPQRDF